ncbi:hypothetical protein MMC25_007351 [Agyrium rufum]|nr:hypothetical protein [Agyrium rufum]
MASSGNDIILFQYPFSPYARRVIWYLQLRGIPYSQSNQPHMLPRPDVKALGINYRRIPFLSIGRDVYIDTRLILSTLDTNASKLISSSSLKTKPKSHLSPLTTPYQHAISSLLERWYIEGGIFSRAAQLIPLDSPAMKDPKFVKDRQEFTGASWEKEERAKVRPEALMHFRDVVRWLEEGLLADGRDWIAETGMPSLVDIQAIWPIHWLKTMPGALPADLISAQQFPKVFAWVSRFDNALKTAQQDSSFTKPTSLKPDEMKSQIWAASHFVPLTELKVDENDPLGLKQDEEVEVWPTDSGFRHKDSGPLKALNEREVVIETRGEGQSLMLHFPRILFRVRKAGEKANL